MILTRQEKEKLIIDLYNQGKNYKQIAVIARVSVRDIKPILEREEKEREKELGIATKEGKGNGGNNPQPQKPSVASQAYRLFSEGKTPLEVAVELNIREAKATRYYREHWKLKQLYHLNQIYEDIKDDVIHIVKLHRRIKAAGIGMEQIINLIKIANNDLPGVEQKYKKLMKDVNSLESSKFQEYRILHDLQDQIADSKRILKYLRTSSQEEEASIKKLQWEKIRLKLLVKRFKETDEEYLKIRKTVQDKVSSILLYGRGLMRLAFYSLIESMRKDPGKYSSLIHYANNDSSTTAWYTDQYYTSYFGNNKYPRQFNSYDSFFEVLKSMLLENADNLYEQLLKEQTDTIISDYASDKSSSLMAKSQANYQESKVKFEKHN